MKSDAKGCSTCPNGGEQYEYFKMGNKKYIQYDYRTPEGELFSTVAKNLVAAREKRNIWVKGITIKGEI